MTLENEVSSINEPALVVLLEIALAATTPKQIALSLGKSPPAVMKQLNWLRERGWIRRGEKKGKLQHYEIVWNKIISFFLRKAPKLNYVNNIEIQQFPSFVHKLSRNERFKELFIYYLMERYRSRKALFGTLGFNIPQSVPQLMENFENSLIYLLPKIKKKPKTKEDKELFRLLEKWRENASDYIPAYRPLESAFKKMGLA